MKPEASKDREEAGEVVYCVIPGKLAERLHEPLREHFRGNPSVEVIVERRNGQRRAAEDCGGDGTTPDSGGGRQGPADMERRVAERRAPVTEVKALPLPRRARRHAERLRFLKRELPSQQSALDLKADRLVARAQAGDSDAFAELYMRFYNLVYSHAKSALGDHHEAEDVTQQVFADALEALPRFEVDPGRPFRAWLLTIARNAALRAIRQRDRLTVEDPEVVERRLERAGRRVEPQMEWLSNYSTRLLIEQLPEDQRRVVALRFLVGLSPAEIAKALNRTSQSVYDLQRRALRALEGTLSQERELTDVRARRAPILTRVRRAPVLRERRWALQGSLGEPAMLARPASRFGSSAGDAFRPQSWRR